MTERTEKLRLNAYISVRDANAAIEFYEKAFGAKLVPPTLRTPDGGIAHAELDIGGAVFMLSEENPDFGNPSPLSLGDTTVRMSLTTSDADAVFAAATAAGAEVVIPLADQFYGHRSGRLRDPFGHLWIISQEVERLTEAEMQARLDAMMKGG